MQHTTSTRRGFLTGRASRPDLAHYPPGVTARSIMDCTGCGECAAACPTKIIAITAGMPILDFARGECTFCGQCAERCPERVFPPEAATKFQHHATIGGDCLAVNFVACQACRNVCGSMAIRFKPRMGGPFVPVLDAAACTGCGACVGVCPTSAVSMVPRTMEAEHA